MGQRLLIRLRPGGSGRLIERAFASRTWSCHWPPRRNGRLIERAFSAYVVARAASAAHDNRRVAAGAGNWWSITGALAPGGRMEFIPLCDMDLHYTSLESLTYAAGGQVYGTMEGTVSGETIRGTVRLTNFAARRPDNVNLPALRGVLDTDDGAKVFVEMNGIATLRAEDRARVFVASLAFRTGDARYDWMNTMFAVLEGVLHSGRARIRAYRCEATM
jgi:hypothetical protein